MAEQPFALRVRFVVSLDADEREVMANLMNVLFRAVQTAFPHRHPSVGIAIDPNGGRCPSCFADIGEPHDATMCEFINDLEEPHG